MYNLSVIIDDGIHYHYIHKNYNMLVEKAVSKKINVPTTTIID